MNNTCSFRNLFLGAGAATGVGAPAIFALANPSLASPVEGALFALGGVYIAFRGWDRYRARPSTSETRRLGVCLGGAISNDVARDRSLASTGVDFSAREAC